MAWTCNIDDMYYALRGQCACNLMGCDGWFTRRLHAAGPRLPQLFVLAMGVVPCAISWRYEVVRNAGSVGQSMMFGWNETGRQPEASWNDFSAIYRAFLKRVSVSEVDKEERPVCYACVPSNTSVEQTILDFSPITFLSCFFIQTAKGMGVISGVLRPSNPLHTTMNVNCM